MKATYEDIDNGIVCIDSGLMANDFAACYVVESNNDYAIIETGTHNTVALLMDYLAQKQIQPQQVKYVIPTHVHLDHAGGAGGLMQVLPEATLLIHPRGARHMIDPAKLKAGAIAVYGEEEFARTYGDVIPIEESRIQIMEDKSSVDLNGRNLVFYDTPGHARHHFCIYDETSNGVFTGDTCGIAYPPLQTENGPFVFPTTTPVQFDPQAMKESISRLMQLKPQYFYLTHFGRIDVSAERVQSLLARIDVFAEKALEISKTFEKEQWQQELQKFLKQYLIQKSKDHGCLQSEEELQRLLAMDIQLNSQGLNVWLNSRST